MLAAAPLSTASAQPTPPPPHIRLTGYIQPQYEHLQVDTSAQDRAIFRRLYVGVQTTLPKHWAATILIDFAPLLENERIGVGDAFLRYNGFADRGIVITMGNQKVPFSRSTLASSRARSLVERPFTGERAFGAPGRAVSAQVDGRHREQTLQWSVSLASVLHSPGIQELRLGGSVDADETWNEGVMATGRAEWHPRGAVPREQGDFTRGAFRVMGALSTYVWRNNGDRNLFTRDGASSSAVFADLGSANAVEASTGIRGHGFSVDGAWSRVEGSTIDPHFTGGIFVGGHTSMHQTAAEAGYMAIASRLELVGGVDSLAIHNRPSIAYRPSAGVVWYIDRHRLKFSATHRESFNVLGSRHARARQTYLQAQYSF